MKVLHICKHIAYLQEIYGLLCSACISTHFKPEIRKSNDTFLRFSFCLCSDEVYTSQMHSYKAWVGTVYGKERGKMQSIHNFGRH